MKYYFINVSKETDQVIIIIDNERYTFPFDELTSVAAEGCPNGITITYKFENPTREFMNYKVIEGRME